MSKGTGVGIIILLVAAMIAILWLWPGTAEAPHVDDSHAARTYTSATYGYSFEYPEGIDVHEYQPYIVAIGHTTGPDAFDSDVDVSVFDSGGEGGYESFDDFVFERGSNLCAADGPRESLHCDAIDSRTDFTTKTGLQGEEVYFTLVHDDFTAGASTTARFGPVYVFNIAANVPDAKFAGLFVYQPLPKFMSAPDADVAKQIVDTLRINKTGE